MPLPSGFAVPSPEPRAVNDLSLEQEHLSFLEQYLSDVRNCDWKKDVIRVSSFLKISQTLTVVAPCLLKKSSCLNPYAASNPLFVMNVKRWLIEDIDAILFRVMALQGRSYDFGGFKELRCSFEDGKAWLTENGLFDYCLLLAITVEEFEEALKMAKKALIQGRIDEPLLQYYIENIEK